MRSFNSTCTLDDAPLIFETINDFGELASNRKTHKIFRKYSVYGVTCIIYYDTYSTPGNTKEVADSSIFTWYSKTPQCDCNTMMALCIFVSCLSICGLSFVEIKRKVSLLTRKLASQFESKKVCKTTYMYSHHVLDLYDNKEKGPSVVSKK